MSTHAQCAAHLLPQRGALRNCIPGFRYKILHANSLSNRNVLSIIKFLNADNVANIQLITYISKVCLIFAATRNRQKFFLFLTIYRKKLTFRTHLDNSHLLKR